MNAASIRAALLAAGLDPAEVPAKLRLLDLIARASADLPQSLRHAWWVPGRLEVFGTHADYAGGRSIVCAVPRGLLLAAGPRGDGLVRVMDARRGEEVIVDPRATRSIFGGWRHYVEVVAERLARNFPGPAAGADIVLASDLPPASGMSSSTALVVGLAAALVRIGRLRDRPEWRASIRDVLDEATYYSCLENGLDFRDLRGDAGVGTHGGSEDHAALLSSEPGALTAFRFVPMVRLAVVPVPAAWRFVICPSGITAEKTGAARDAYNRLAASAAALLDLWNAASPESLSLGAVLETRDALPRLREIVRTSTLPRWPPALLSRRLEHFVRETMRVDEALEACRHSDAPRIGRLAGAAQQDAEELLENQIGATVALTRAALDAGALAARSFGAGFGGSVWALTWREEAHAFAHRWLARYRPEHTGGADAATFVVTPAPPLTELDLE